MRTSPGSCSSSRPRPHPGNADLSRRPIRDGLAATRNAARYQTPPAMLRLTGRGVIDALGAVAERVVAHLNSLGDAAQ